MHKVLKAIWVRAPPVHNITSASIDMITIDYELLHRWLRHPSKDVFRAARKQVKDFPSVIIPPVEPVCSEQISCNQTFWTHTLRSEIFWDWVIS